MPGLSLKNELPLRFLILYELKSDPIVYAHHEITRKRLQPPQTNRYLPEYLKLSLAVIWLKRDNIITNKVNIIPKRLLWYVPLQRLKRKILRMQLLESVDTFNPEIKVIFERVQSDEGGEVNQQNKDILLLFKLRHGLERQVDEIDCRLSKITLKLLHLVTIVSIYSQIQFVLLLSAQIAGRQK